MNRWITSVNYWIVNGISNVRQAEMHTAEPSVHEPSSPEAEIGTEKLKR